jgi:hypothetical protein
MEIFEVLFDQREPASEEIEIASSPLPSPTEQSVSLDNGIQLSQLLQI